MEIQIFLEIGPSLFGSGLSSLGHAMPFVWQFMIIIGHDEDDDDDDKYDNDDDDDDDDNDDDCQDFAILFIC